MGGPRAGNARASLALSLLAAALLACGSKTVAVAPLAAPAGLAYTSADIAYTKGAAIAPNVPSSSGGAIAAYAVAPALPAGLALDPASGVIGGTPSAITARAPYVVTASNASGSATATVTIAVNDAAPSSLTYTNPDAVYIKGTAIPPNAPSSRGGAVTGFAIAPALPDGLVLDPATGVLSGTPAAVSPAAAYTVTARNSGGSATAQLRLAVNPLPPVITAPPANASIYEGQTATFAVTAAGTGPLSYQWSRNDAPIAAATASSYTTGPQAVADEGATFKVTVADSYGGRATSAAATLHVAAYAGFVASGSLARARQQHTASLLPGGRVLIAGGFDGVRLNAQELYDPATGAFTSTGDMTVGRVYQAQLVLKDGRVLVMGGDGQSGGSSKSADLYDAATGRFTPTGDLVTGRTSPMAALLSDGRVLVTGGGGSSIFTSAEIYDPATGTFKATGDLQTARLNHYMATLKNGKVLVAGGRNTQGTLRSAELFDPATGTFTATGSMKDARYSYDGVLFVLGSGKVLVAGGIAPGGPVKGAELYDPDTGVFTPTGDLVAPRQGDSQLALPGGKVLLIGGVGPNPSGSYVQVPFAETYDPATGVFSAGPALRYPRNYATATLLPSGKVLLAGGTGCSTASGYCAISELYQ